MNASSSPLLVLDLNQETYLEYLPFFSDEASVVRIHIPFPANIFDVKIPVSSFWWPIPSLHVVVCVHEPDVNGFHQRLKAGGLPLPVLEDDTEELDALYSMPDIEMDSPGSTVSMDCPGCLFKEMQVESLSVRWALTENFAKKYNLNWVFEPCKDHMGHLYIGGRKAIVFRCLGCMDTYISLSGRGLIRHLKEEG